MMFPQIMVKTKHVVAKTLIFMGQLPKFHRLKPIFLEHFCQANSQPLHSIPGKPAVPANQHLRKSCICFNECFNVLCVCKKTLNMCKFCPILPSFPRTKQGVPNPGSRGSGASFPQPGLIKFHNSLIRQLGHLAREEDLGCER